MSDHPLTETVVAELWDAHREPGVVPLSEQGRAYARNQTVLFRAAFDAGREHEREHTDPHHDPRPWQDCTREDICKGDLVESRRGDSLIVGVARDQNGHGDWWAKDGWHLTWDDRWPLRRIPAPTPPAEEVELPAEFGDIITDVEADLGEAVRLDRMVWTGRHWAYQYHWASPGFIIAFTLTDGTRARRDGDHTDGRPRFIKVREADQ